MRILVTTPTGNIGSRIVHQLLDSGHSITLLARDPSRLSESVRGKTTVIQGSLDDASSLRAALAGANAAFFLIPPPGPNVTHWRRWQESLGETFAAAAKASGVSRVVFLSSTGAQHDDLGAISGLGIVERTLKAALPNVVAVRAGYFMENSFGSLPTIASQGAFYGVAGADVQQQVVATQDIGDIAARWLVDDAWTGHQVVGAHGPTTISANESAAVFSDVLGRPVRYVQIPAPALREALLAAGFPELLASGYEQMMGGMSAHFDAGDFSDEPQSAASAGAVSFREFTEKTLKPAFDAQFAATV
jgi:uncharacterized protein YbjT (DUF2867 family)